MTPNQVTRPAEVSKGVKLLYRMLGLGVINSIITMFTIPNSELGFTLTILIFVFLAMIYIIQKIGSRSNGARITFLVLTMIGTPFSLMTLIQNFEYYPVSSLITLIISIFQIVALVYLFQKPSSEWFTQGRVISTTSTHANSGQPNTFDSGKYESLSKLKQALDEGLITDDEFKSEKVKLLNN